MYNLMVTASSHAWEEGAYVWCESRILEYTSDDIKTQLGPLSPDALKHLTTLPSLFTYEDAAEGVPRTGKIKHVQQRGSDIRIIFEFDNAFPNLTREKIEKLKWDLEIEDFEFSRTHWAVKSVDLYAVLRSSGTPEIALQPSESKPATVEVSPEQVFLVHGRSTGDLETVARFLETRVGLQVCILGERPNKGRTIITKFQEEAAGAGYAVVLMTPDDFGYLRPELSGNQKATPAPRARQNVILELGFFIGKLGANRVCVLLGSGVEKPSDYDGVVYIPFDDHGGWKMKLVNELQAANVYVSSNWWNEG